MIPGEYDIEIYQGDTYYGPVITLPNLSGLGGPADLTTAVVTAQVRTKETAPDALAEFEVEGVDDVARQVRLTLSHEDTAALTVKKGVWDLQVEEGTWVGTVLKGQVVIAREVTR